MMKIFVFLTLVFTAARGEQIPFEIRTFDKSIEADELKEVKRLQDMWDAFFAEFPSCNMIQTCHRMGAISVRNALMSYDKKKRKKIIVIACAPVIFIPEDLCKSVMHYQGNTDASALMTPKDIPFQEVFITMTETLEPYESPIYGAYQRHEIHYALKNFGVR